MMSHSVIVIGSGGHARVLLDCLFKMSVDILGITEVDEEKCGDVVLGIPVIGKDEKISDYPADRILLINGLGSVGDPSLRMCLFSRFRKLGYHFGNVIHPLAVLSPFVEFGEGVQIMAGTVVQPGCFIGDNVIINTRSSLDHDCYIGDHVHVAPGVTLSGGVEVGAGSHIGTGATVIQGVHIGKNSLVAAGSVVIHDVTDGVTVKGVPARECG